MDYDFGTTQTFWLELIDIADMKRGWGRRYPYVLDGAVRGIIEDMSCEEMQAPQKRGCKETHRHPKTIHTQSNSGRVRGKTGHYRCHDVLVKKNQVSTTMSSRAPNGAWRAPGNGYKFGMQYQEIAAPSARNDSGSRWRAPLLPICIT